MAVNILKVYSERVFLDVKKPPFEAVTTLLTACFYSF